MLQLYDSLTQQKSPFISSKSNQVDLYVCGMTVYDYCHIGHARVWIVFDILTRYLKDLGFSVNYIRNITDVDDKIIQRAAETHQSIQALTQHMITEMQADAEALSVLPPTQEPRATDHIPHMIQLIKTLIEKQYAYLSTNGDVYYAVNHFQAYGKLAHQSLESLMSGARVAIEPDKQHPLDFVLWKRVKNDEPSWDSPWGPGRPGWHIECSAMAMHYLGESFDIHGGGADLRFPHHQNEIAQSEAVSEKPFAKHWMHVGFVNINDEKMSKSQGNALSIRELRAQYPAEVLRYFLLSSHYRSPLNWSIEHIKTAAAAIKRLHSVLRNYKSSDSAESIATHLVEKYEKAFRAAMEDDLNTPVALSVLFDIVRAINRSSLEMPEAVLPLIHLLRKLGGLLGLLQQDPEQFFSQMMNQEKHAWIAAQVALREEARQQKAWKTADDIRQSLLAEGILLEDTPTGTRWQLKDEFT